MWTRSRWNWAVVAAGVASAMPGAAHATVLWLGLPSGRSQAYVAAADGSSWSRASAADLPDVGSTALPTFADLDGDGDRDALVGESTGRAQAFQNTGSNGAPAWTRRPEWDPPLAVGSRPAPALGDLDGDGDADLVVGSAQGTVHAIFNTGSPAAPAWAAPAAWKLAGLGSDTRPALGDVNGDGRLDLLIGNSAGAVTAFAGGAGGAMTRQPAWDAPVVGTRVAPALGDLDGDGRPDLVIEDGNAQGRAFRNADATWVATPAWNPPDPGSGPGGPALVPGALSGGGEGGGGRPSGGGGNGPVARLEASPVRGQPPLAVEMDASASADPRGGTLVYVWDFGDGTSPTQADSSDPGAVLRAAMAAYERAKDTRDDGKFDAAVQQYLTVVQQLLPLTGIALPGPKRIQGTNRIDRVAQWQLGKIGHDLGAIYLYRSMGLAPCDQYATSLQYSRESHDRYVAGGFPDLPPSNGTDANVAKAKQKLNGKKCPIPAPQPMFGTGAGGGPVPAGPTVQHVYTRPGTYTARVTVASTSGGQASAEVEIEVGGTTPPPPGGGGDGYTDGLEGFGATTRGGAGGREIRITEATDRAVRTAFSEASKGNAIVKFDVAGPIEILEPLPRLEGAYVTIEGNGAALIGTRIGRTAAMIDVRGHDVIVRDLRLRSGGDNIRAQGDGAYNVVFSHLSSTGAGDDGISIGYGAKDVTVQYCFLAGNTRSIFLKYGSTTRVSLHHNWIMKQWIRGPLVSQSVLADVRNNVVEDWSMWGMRFESESSGNAINNVFVLSDYARSIGGKPGSALRLQQSGPVFTSGNVYLGGAQDTDQGRASGPLDVAPVTTHPAHEAAEVVRARAGCMPRDAVDQAYIDRTDGWHVGKYEPFRLQ